MGAKAIARLLAGIAARRNSRLEGGGSVSGLGLVKKPGHDGAPAAPGEARALRAFGTSTGETSCCCGSGLAAAGDGPAACTGAGRARRAELSRSAVAGWGEPPLQVRAPLLRCGLSAGDLLRDAGGAAGGARQHVGGRVA